MRELQGTKILPCTCEHKDQDEMYGKGMRVHNVCDKKGAQEYGNYYCTVCSPRKVDKEKNTILPLPILGMHRTLFKAKLKNAKKG